jgi:hypothetical protein
VAGAPQRSKLPVAALLGALVAAVALAAGGGLLAIQWLADRDGSAGEQLAAGQQDGGSTGSTEQGAEGEGSDTVDTGGNVELGDSGIIGESGDTGAAVGLVPDPASHLDVEPCAGGGDLTAGSPLEALAEVQVTNRHSEPVDYQLKVDFFTGDGARLDETYDSVYALPPGESALLQFRSFEVGAVACELVELTSTAVDRAAYDARGNTEIQSCELDDFFDNQVNTQYRATNPLDVTADLEIWFAVLDSEGIRIDDSFSSTFSDVAAGGAIQETAEETYFDLPWAGRTVAECIVTKMEVEPAT